MCKLQSVSRSIVVSTCLAGILALPAEAAAPSVQQALRMKPVQQDVAYDQPNDENKDDCKLKAAKPVSGWMVEGPDGLVLRRFLNTNDDNKIDMWCYYKDGIEVYRDIDTDKNGRADQYRWLGTGGTRWGIDSNEDGTIDRWKAISPEELSGEIVRSIRTKDKARFNRLLPTKEELESLGLGSAKMEEISAKIGQATKAFAATAGEQTAITNQSKWINFSGTRPGTIPAGTDESTKDIMVYENTVAIVDTNGTISQLAIGTLIRVGETWRAIDLPSNLAGNQNASDGYFFNASIARRPVATQGTDRRNLAIQKLMEQIEETDRKLTKTTLTAEKAKLHERKAELLEEVLESTNDEKTRPDWIRQLADTLSASAQSGDYPDGTERLATFYRKISQEIDDRPQLPYVKFRYLTAVYSTSLQDPKADLIKVQENWLQQLEEFVNDFPKSQEAAEAMLQLGIAEEFSGKEDSASDWYRRIANDFPDSLLAKKATGAERRIKSVGRSIELRGKTVSGKPFSLSSNQNKVILLHYWASWCEPCKKDIEKLKQLHGKYADRGFLPVGINVDTDIESMRDSLKNQNMRWPQLYEHGGLDSRLANELGILSLPTMLLFDQQGKLVNRNVHGSELETEVGKLIR